MLRALAKTGRRDLVISLILQLLSIFLDYANIVAYFFLWKYLRRCDNARGNGDPIPSFAQGFAYIIIIPVNVIIYNTAYYHGRYRSNMVGAEIRSACIGLAAKKACTIDPTIITHQEAPYAETEQAGVGSNSTGDGDAARVHASDTNAVFTLCTVHVERLSELATDVIGLIRALANLCLILGFLAWFLSWLSAVFLAITLVTFSSTAIALARSLKERRIADGITNIRVAELESIFSGMRLIKYFGWENSFLERILTVREQETKANLRQVGWNSFYSGIFVSTVTFAPIVIYGIYASQHSLTDSPAIVMGGVILLTYDRNVHLLNRAITGILNAWPSAMRVQDMLTAGDSDHSRTTTIAPVCADHAVELSSAQFDWDLHREASPDPVAAALTDVEKQATKDVDFESRKSTVKFEMLPVDISLVTGELVAIVGPTQAGKSSILAGLTSEMPLREGQMRLNGLPAYCPQHAWIQSATVKENILFGQRYDTKIYEAVLETCCLKADLETFADGDLSELGERGINLSGGQQHRVHLARTLYQALADDRKIILLDDPLSAVDAIVSSVIFDKAISEKGLLAGRCRVLVTHQLQYLARCDRVVYMRDGRILADGTLADLMHIPAFSDFLGNQTQSREQEHINSKTVGSEANELTQPTGPTGDEDQVIMEEERAAYHVPAKTYVEAVGSYRDKIVFVLIALAAIVSQIAWVFICLQTAWWTSNRWQVGLVANTMIYFGITLAHALTWGPYMWMIRVFWVKRAVVYSSDALRGVMRAPASFHNANPTSRLINRFTSDISHLDTAFPYNYWFFTLILLFMLSMVVGVLTYIPLMTTLLIPWVTAGVFVFSVWKSCPLEIKRLSVNMQSTYLSLLHEGLSGRTTIALAKHEEAFRHGIYQKMDEHNSIYFLGFATFEWASVLQICAFGIIMFCTGLLLLHTRLDSPPSVQTIVFAMLATAGTLLGLLLEGGSNCQRGVNAIQRLTHFANDLPDEGVCSPAAHCENLENWPSEGHVTFDNISLQYKTHLPMVLKGVGFEVRGGEKVGVVGRTGAGKSTLLMALLRLYDLAEGRILIDGHDINSLGIHTVRHAIATIPQHPTMFIGSVRFNLDPTGEKTDAQLLHALELVNLVGDRAEGKAGSLTLDTHVQEGGRNFSSGQRQLLSLARALAKQSKIIIIDEATSDVDLAMDAVIQQTIRRVFADCTVMTIAHRLRSIIGYDRVVVMDKGEVVELGSPRELFCNRGYFRSLCEQASVELGDFLEEDDVKKC